MIKKFSIFVFLFFLGFSIFAQESEYEKNVLSFNIQGVKLGCTLKEFKSNTKFTSEYYESLSQPEINQKVYVSEDVPNMDTCVFRFFEDKLYGVRVLYEPDTVNRMGGSVAVLGKLVERYGQKFDPPSRENDEAIFEGYMDFPRIKRNLYAIVKSTVLIIEMIDMETYDKMTEKKKGNMDLGF